MRLFIIITNNIHLKFGLEELVRKWNIGPKNAM